MADFLQEIPVLFIQFLLTAVFSFIVGLEQRKQYTDKEDQHTFGTDRTFVFIGLFGFVLLIAQPVEMYFYLGGGLVLSLFLGIFYFQKIRFQNNYGLTTVLLALLTYTLPLLIITQPNWLVMLFFVLVLILTESKHKIRGFSEKIDRTEFITLAKFIIIAG
ncbi:MAG TPA: MgtC/SapB family protein, partial [Draconibacterium sp.]|nr:MgtC/SapB family protein [Draconibacterium sp.]